MQPYISVVTASRNDDHGGDPLHRTQIFINCFAQQCDKHKLPAELILVDWNPVPDRPGLAAVLTLPPRSEYCSARVISVPAALHDTIKYGDRLAFFQMIAKNVAIRRARGDFVLATNIDIIFSDELVAFLARRTLDSMRMYRVDRYDIKADLAANANVDIILDKAWRNIIRTNRRANLQEVLDPIYGHDAACRDCTPHIKPGRQSEKINLVREDEHLQLRPHPTSPIEHLNTNACGDFKLLSKQGWAAIRGYPDFEAFSFNIDSMGLVMAHYEGFHETSLLPPCVCFHIEHGLGSGYTPEGEQKLFDRLRAKRILSPDWPVLNPWVAQMQAEQKAIRFNRDDWGLADYDLPEEPLGTVSGPEFKEALARVKPLAGSVGSLYPQYDLDSVTLFHERESRQPLPSASPPSPAPVAAPAVLAPRVPVAAPFVAADGDAGLFDHAHGSYSLLDHYAGDRLASGRPVLAWATPDDLVRLASLLEPSLGPRLHAVNGGGGGGDWSSGDYDGLLLAGDPHQLVLDLHRHGLLAPRAAESEILIWVQGDESAAQREARWRSALRLARRLLTAAGWQVQIGSRSAIC
jgi:hypothetical protein